MVLGAHGKVISWNAPKTIIYKIGKRGSINGPNHKPSSFVQCLKPLMEVTYILCSFIIKILYQNSLKSAYDLKQKQKYFCPSFQSTHTIGCIVLLPMHDLNIHWTLIKQSINKSAFYASVAYNVRLNDIPYHQSIYD